MAEQPPRARCPRCGIECDVMWLHLATGEPAWPRCGRCDVQMGPVPDTGAESRWRRLKTCVEAWPDCVSGEYNPACCRFPKSCSCMADPDETPGHLLEPVPDTGADHESAGVRIPKDPEARERLYREAGLTDEERAAMNRVFPPEPDTGAET